MLGEGARTYETLMQRESNKRAISLDPNVRQAMFPDRTLYRQRIERLLKLATLVKVSEDDLSWPYPGEQIADIATRWLTDGPSLVIVTLGAVGAVGISGDAVVSVPGVRVDVADTVGAGDAFMSALLARLDDERLLSRDALETLNEDILVDALTYANTAAAVTCTRHGANPPTRCQIEEFNNPPH